MEKLTISTAIFNSFLYVYQTVHTPYEMIKSPSVTVELGSMLAQSLPMNETPKCSD